MSGRIINVIVATKGGTGIPIGYTVEYPDTQADAHRRVTAVIDKYRYEHTRPGDEPGNTSTLSIEENKDGEVLIVFAQDAPAGDPEILADCVKYAIRHQDPVSGPS